MIGRRQMYRQIQGAGLTDSVPMRTSPFETQIHQYSAKLVPVSLFGYRYWSRLCRCFILFLINNVAFIRHLKHLVDKIIAFQIKTV